LQGRNYIYQKTLITCLNCGYTFKGEYCSHCGQKAEQERFTPSVVVAEMLHFFTHFEKGFLHTVWSFIAKPGRASLNFLNGKRKQYQSPVSYLFICTGLYILIHNFIVNHYHYHISAQIFSKLSINEQANVLLRTHFTPFIIITLIVSAFIIYLILARPAFYFTEIFILTLYGGGTYMTMLLLSDIILGIIFKIDIITPGVFLWQAIISLLYNFWFCVNLFTKVKVHFLWLKLFTVAILIAVIGLALFNYLPLAWLYILKH
jgi:hypothetical protein